MQNLPADRIRAGRGLRADDALQGMCIKAHLRAGRLHTDSCLAYVQRQVAGVWRAARGMSGVAVPATSRRSSATTTSARGRRRPTPTGCASRPCSPRTGTIASSPWNGPSAIAGPNLIGTGWNLKAVNLPAASWLSAGILTEPSESDQTQATIFYPLDRPCPVVVKGTAGGWAGSYDFIASGAAAVAAVRALVDYEGSCSSRPPSATPSTAR